MGPTVSVAACAEGGASKVELDAMRGWGGLGALLPTARDVILQQPPSRWHCLDIETGSNGQLESVSSQATTKKQNIYTNIIN